MAKKKETIVGIGKNPENQLTVQKSRPLYDLWRSNLTLGEFKILDVYLSRIDSHKPEKCTVTLDKGEIESCLGVKKINMPDLEKRLLHLGQGIKIPDPSLNNGFRIIWLFEEAHCEQDEYGQWKVTLSCSKKALKYFFNIENLGYLRYKLRCVSGLKSRYSYILFLYLEANRFRKCWEVSVDELKELLNCQHEETYQQFKRFNDRLLKRCYNEILEKTECRFTYQPVRRGRTVVSIRFEVETLKDIELLASSAPYLFSNAPLSEFDDEISFLQEACSRNDGTPEFSRIEIEEIFSVLATLPNSVLPNIDFACNDIEFRRYHYLIEKYARMNRVDQQKKIKNRVSYFIKMIKADRIIEP